MSSGLSPSARCDLDPLNMKFRSATTLPKLSSQQPITGSPKQPNQRSYHLSFRRHRSLSMYPCSSSTTVYRKSPLLLSPPQHPQSAWGALEFPQSQKFKGMGSIAPSAS